MKLLLDTAAFLWLILDSPRLSATARSAVTDPSHEVYLSVVSCWEIAVKHALGRLPLPSPPQSFIRTQREAHAIESLRLAEESVLTVVRLPRLHSDPFDRMLICQALAHGLTVVTPDEQIAQYPVRVLW